MKTLKELRESLPKWQDYENSFELKWYKTAIEWILKDIQESEVISVVSIEKYLEDLLNK